MSTDLTVDPVLRAQLEDQVRPFMEEYDKVVMEQRKLQAEADALEQQIERLYEQLAARDKRLLRIHERLMDVRTPKGTPEDGVVVTLAINGRKYHAGCYGEDGVWGWIEGEDEAP